MRPRDAMPPTTKCSSPCQLTAPARWACRVGSQGRVGDGDPAATSPAPYTPSSKGAEAAPAPPRQGLRRDPERGCDCYEARDDEVGELESSRACRMGEQAEVVCVRSSSRCQSWNEAEYDVDGSSQTLEQKKAGVRRAWLRRLVATRREGVVACSRPLLRLPEGSKVSSSVVSGRRQCRRRRLLSRRGPGASCRGMRQACTCVAVRSLVRPEKMLEPGQLHGTGVETL